ncbi:carboxypeptidase M32 [Paenibacillus sp. CMAA1739]|uniref:carboxypeptidase M32 n=1 Tax=Paenibacillus ottowii TaxID=2315729 RepID=UPI002730821A|nr:MULTISPECIES: carboxypeptidase M32 [Paenibacillus]MDP1508597.1 carboxypeptidase M32 [Paenibacillus ottowii]MEC4565281.1 carboxypeptidase M32 [Paenibacillus sp. CMAA1739]
MEQQTLDQWTALKEISHKISGYGEAVGLLHWDLRTGAPRKGVDIRSETLGMLSTEMFKLMISDEMGQLLQFFAAEDKLEQLEDNDRRLVEECRKNYDLNRSVPADRYREYSILAAQAESKWEEAKEHSDFAGFEPYLSKIVDMKREFIGYWGVKDTEYDTLLDQYEPGMTVEKLDAVFDRLKKRLVPLLSKIQASPNQPDKSFLDGVFEVKQQEKFSLFILGQMGYDFDAGRLDESVHPFATGLNPGDVRITTHYLQDDVTSAIFSSLHEGGHALYEQNIAPELAGSLLSGGTSMGIHESQSRLWENKIGRSRAFWDRYYNDLQKHFPDRLAKVTAEQFYLAVNRVENSLIRIEADELTYNLHIIVRYEIEKMLFNEKLDVKRLPEVWNAKYKEYLGLLPPNDGLGVLQDVHWSGGDFGYFASYSLGNMYAAQIFATLRKELPNLDEFIAAGELEPIKQWLTERIYRYGKSRTPSELIVAITGEDLNPDYLADYLEEKYTSIYKL